jgi:hypothetical protein
MIYSSQGIRQEAKRRGETREEAVMTGEDVRQVFEAIVPSEAIERWCVPFGVIERQRTRDLGRLVRAMVLSAGTPGGAYQADVLRSYLECEVPHVARSAFYRWFDAPLAHFMAALADRALAYAQAPQVALSGLLAGVKDWSIVDSTTVKVRDARQDECPGPGDDAALKVHTVLSVGCGAPVRDHVSPARAHDSRHLTIDASWRGCGLLADLAYASLTRLRACTDDGVVLVIRLKDHWKPKVEYVARGQVTPAFFSGTDFDALLADEILILDGRALDADVHVGTGNKRGPVRLVGVNTPTGDGVFLTNLPPRIGPRQVTAISRGRWEVELRIRLDTSVHRLDQIDAECPCSVKTLLHASRMAAMITALLAHPHHRATRPPQEGMPRTQAPRHPRRLALPLAVSCQSIAQAMDLQGAAAQQRWQQIAALLVHRGRDPNWRRRPSVLDQLRGWNRQPVVRNQTSRGNLKAVA